MRVRESVCVTKMWGGGGSYNVAAMQHPSEWVKLYNA
jgi:hypothetical protein